MNRYRYLSEKEFLQLGTMQGRNLKLSSLEERVCSQPGSHSHSKRSELFVEGLQVPFPHWTSLHTSSENYNFTFQIKQYEKNISEA